MSKEQKPSRNEAQEPPHEAREPSDVTTSDVTTSDTTPEAQAAAKPKEPHRASGRASSDVGSLAALALAAPLYALFLGAARVMPKDARALLLERGWVPHAIMILTSLALAILALKAVKLVIQRRAFSLDVLPEGQRITGGSVLAMIEHVEALRTASAIRRRLRSFLLERVLRILLHFAARGDAAETVAANDSDAEADAAAVASSFSMVKVLVWAIPILGFIGTVIGIGDAVGGFSRSLDGADQLDSIKSSLHEVTSGLAVAFDTTLVALCASILVMLPMSFLQKAEEQLLHDVDDHCVTHVLRRLASANAEEPKPALDVAEMRRAVAETLAAPLGEMLAANARLMSRLTEDRSAIAEAQSTLLGELGAFAEAARALGPSIERAAAKIDEATARIGEAASEMGKAASEVGPSVDRAAKELGRATTVAEEAAGAAGRTQDQLSRELGASRQLLSLLAAGLGAEAPAKAKHAHGSNGAAALGE